MKNTTKYKNILITGGAGFIGSRLALQLIDRGYEITVLDNLSPQYTEFSLWSFVRDLVILCGIAFVLNTVKDVLS